MDYSDHILSRNILQWAPPLKTFPIIHSMGKSCQENLQTFLPLDFTWKAFLVLSKGRNLQVNDGNFTHHNDRCHRNYPHSTLNHNQQVRSTDKLGYTFVAKIFQLDKPNFDQINFHSYEYVTLGHVKCLRATFKKTWQLCDAKHAIIVGQFN